MSTTSSAPSAPTTSRRPAPMTLWRLEVARLVRTHRWLIVVGVYAFFGVIGPLTARYLNEILERFGGGIQMTAPDPRPADGIVQFVGNVSQLGLLAVVVVAAAALALDTKPEVAAFLRTKVSRPGLLLIPPYVVSVGAAVLALVLGTGIAWILSEVLIGSVAGGAVILGTLLGALYLAFAIAIVALVAGYMGSQATTVFAALAVLLLFPLVGIIQPLREWLPSQLLTAVAPLVEGAGAGEFLRSTIVTVVATAILLVLASRRMGHREL